MNRWFLILILIAFQQVISSAQVSVMDSLKIVLNTSSVADTTKAKALNLISWEYAVTGDYNSGIKYSNEALDLINNAEKSVFFEHEKARAFINLGIIHYYKSDYIKSLEFYLRSLPILEELKDNRSMGSVYNNIGLVYDDKGEYNKSLEFFLKGLDFRERLGDKKAIAGSYGNIGGIYYSTGDYTKALEYHMKAVKIREETGDKKGLGSSFNNIGIIYDDKGEYQKALEYQLKSVAIKQETGDKKGQALSYGNMGNTYKHMGDHKKALEFFSKSLSMKEEIGDRKGMASSFHNIGLLYFQLNNISEARNYQVKSLAVSKSIASRPDIVKAYEALSALDSATGDFKSAYHHHKQYTLLKDSIFNEEASKKVVESEMNFAFEKKEQAAKLEQEKKDALAGEELKKQKMQRNGFIGGFILMLALAGVIFRSYRNKRRSHRIIAQQKELVEAKNRDISDSINYAKRLQQAILPSERSFKESLENSFIFYKPKDIVAGDFYWMEKKGDVVFIAAADCTGHGVPGAMISVVCSNALNRTVKEFGITEPGKILDKVRELVIETFEKSESEVKDGMDISLCAINNKTKEVLWAGANNSLWYLMNNEIKEIKPDKQPIGKHEFSKPFTTHHLHLKNDDILYLFTDGYADQFGGEKGKKFKCSRFKELLLSASDKPMNVQKQLVEEAFNTWKGMLDQVDDVCVIGIRI